MTFLKNVLALQTFKKIRYFRMSLFTLSLIFSFQNCQQSQNHFSSTNSSQASLASSSSVGVNLSSEPVNPADCSAGIKVAVSLNDHSLANAVYSFDGGKTWSPSNFKIYLSATKISVGEVIVKGDSASSSEINTAPYDVNMTGCNLVSNPVTTPQVFTPPLTSLPATSTQPALPPTPPPQKWSFKVTYDRYHTLSCQGSPFATNIDYGYYGKWNDYGQNSYEECEASRQNMLVTICDIPDEYQVKDCQSQDLCFSGNVKPYSACELMP
ncbi:MAG: hypothetical protein ACXVCN_06160 [Bdellovibrio sp.]